MAFGWALLLKLGLSTNNYFSVPLEEMARIGVSINLDADGDQSGADPAAGWRSRSI